MQSVADYEASEEEGERLISDIFERIEMLGRHPDLGRVVPEFDLSSLRELIQSPFRIVYRQDPGEIRIARIWRGEQLLRLPEEA